MPTIKLRRNQVAIEKIKKQSKGQGALIIPDGEEYLGHIRYVGVDADKSLVVGQKAYFTTKYQQFRMEGKDLCVMDDAEVVAIVEE